MSATIYDTHLQGQTPSHFLTACHYHTAGTESSRLTLLQTHKQAPNRSDACLAPS